MKRIMALILMIITAGVVLSCESLFNDQMDALQSNYFHGTKQFYDSDGAGSDWFGYSVAVSADGSTVTAGVPQDDAPLNNQGSIWVCRWNGSSWVEKKITAYDGTAINLFGYSVSVSDDGNIVVTGAPGNDSYKGAAYVYRWNGSSWMENKITGSDGVSNDRFGTSVAVSADGSTIAVGAHYNGAGSAYVYRWDGSLYVQMEKLTASDGANDDKFGTSIAISGNGNTVVVGAPEDDITLTNQGSAYVFCWNGSSWVESKIMPSDGSDAAVFGTSVAVSKNGSTVVAGAPADIATGNYSGAIYLYRWNGSSWGEVKIIPDDGYLSDRFGFSVAISGDGTVVLAGAYQDDIESHPNQGSTYVYHWNGSSYVLMRKITVSDGASNDYYGYSVAISADGSTFVMGAYQDDIVFGDQGSAWLYAE